MLAPATAIAIASILLLVGIAMARASAPGEATATIQRADARSREILARQGSDQQKLEEEVGRLLRELFDARALVEEALSTHWAGMTSAQRDEIVRLVETLVVRSHIRSLRTYGRFPVEYVEETSKGGRQLVRSVVRAEKRGRPAAITLVWALTREGTSWRVRDLVTDGVSLVANYRSQFNRVIAKEGVDGLIGRLRRKAAEAAR